LLSVPVQVIAWRTVSGMTCNVSSGTLNLTHSLTAAAYSSSVYFSGFVQALRVPWPRGHCGHRSVATADAVTGNIMSMLCRPFVSLVSA